jgi:hypothetical protein
MNMKVGSVDVWRGVNSNRHNHHCNVRRRCSICVAMLAQILKVIFLDILAPSLVFESGSFFILYVFNYVYPILHKKRDTDLFLQITRSYIVCLNEIVWY